MKLSKQAENLSGKRFGNILVLSPAYKKDRAIYWHVKCKCGRKYVKKGAHLKYEAKFNNNLSCRQCSYKIHHKHGGLSSKYPKSYETWSGMIARCTNPNDAAYHNYGGRGITVCKRWLTSFEAFVEDMGERPDDRSLDRINNNKGYSKSNCRWATNKQQARNVRNNRLYLIDGDEKTIQEWIEHYGLSIAYNTVYMRVVKQGYTIQDALFCPIKKTWKNRKR